MFRSMLAAALLALPMTAKAETVRLYAAGSLKAALTDWPVRSRPTAAA